jgi:cobalt-zinc-cadmium efflux system outer membrane protein
VAPSTQGGFADSLAGVPPAPVVRGPLSLTRAIELALSHSPTLSERTWTSRAEVSRARDETRLANPTLDFTDEDWGGDIGSGRDERTLQIAQPLRFGVRGARRDVASGLERLSRYDQQAARREVALQVADAFIEAWWLQRRVGALRRSEVVATAAIAAARERTRIGAAPVVEGLRAEASSATQTTERRRAEVDLEDARLRLATEWGASEATFDTLDLEPPDRATPGNVDSLLLSVDRRPEVQRATAETAVAAARLRAARAERFPELTPSGGVRRLNESQETGFVAGLSLGIPLWNRGQDRIAAAEAEYRAAAARELRVRAGLRQELAGLDRRMRFASEDYEIVATRTRPAARAALESLGSGYRAGRFTYLDYVEGQRAMTDVELAMLDAVRDYWRARVALEWGAGIEPPPSPTETHP